MFGKKKNKKEEASKPSVDVQAMPDIFYGGQNPSIYGSHKKETNSKEKEKKKKKVKKQEIKKPVPQRPLPTPTQTATTVEKKEQHIKPPKQGFISANKGIVIAIVVFVVIAIAGSSFLILSSDSDTTPVPAPVAIQPTPAPVEELEPFVPEPVIEVEEEIEIEEPESLSVLPLIFPQVVLSDSSDIDDDSLTDLEEEIFQTDSGNLDSDGDGYYDGLEVVNLYNPTGFAPVKIIESGLVKEYKNPTWQYLLYYPETWVAASVDENDNQVLLSDITGDYIEIRVIEKQTFNESFGEWFGREAQTEYITDLDEITNRFENDLWRRQDGLVGYLDDVEEVYVVIYHPSEEGPVAFRHVMEMVLQSFRSGEKVSVLPPQEIVPLPPEFDNGDSLEQNTPTEDNNSIIEPEEVTPDEALNDTIN